MYGKIFESMYDGTLSADWKAMVTFQQLIVLADSEGVIDYTPAALSRRTGIPLDIIEHGIKKLEQPDPYSRSSDLEGRRISLLDDHRPWGWQIVNYEHYRDLAKLSEKREQSRQRKRKQREKASQDTDSKDVSHDVTQGHAPSRMSRHADVDADVDKTLPSGVGRTRASRIPDDFELTDERREVAEAEQVPAERTFASFCDHWRSAGGQKARKVDWDATWRNWCRREADFSRNRSGGKADGFEDPYITNLRRSSANAGH